MDPKFLCKRFITFMNLSSDHSYESSPSVNAAFRMTGKPAEQYTANLPRGCATSAQRSHSPTLMEHPSTPQSTTPCSCDD